jgi:23S rRNA (guanosine2251-2'-O)-methyltransferase
MTHTTDVMVGFHAVQSLLKTAPNRAKTLLVVENRSDQRVQKTIGLAERANIPVNVISVGEMDKYADNARHQGVALLACKGKVYDEAWMISHLTSLDHAALVLVLDGITDPHNLGACLRSADGAGVDAVIVPRDKSCGLTPIVRKVASGAAEIVPFVLVTNLSRTLQKLQDAGVWIVGAAGESEQAISDIDLTGPVALVLGSEDRGLRHLTRERCDYLARIPMQGSVQSLNVSVATGIVLFEAVRQRMGAALKSLQAS